MFAEYNDIIKLKLLTDTHMEAYMKENKCDRDHYTLVIKNQEECPKDAPKRKAGMFSTRPCIPDEIDEELSKLKERIEELEKKATNES